MNRATKMRCEAGEKKQSDRKRGREKEKEKDRDSNKARQGDMEDDDRQANVSR